MQMEVVTSSHPGGRFSLPCSASQDSLFVLIGASSSVSCTFRVPHYRMFIFFISQSEFLDYS